MTTSHHKEFWKVAVGAIVIGYVLGFLTVVSPKAVAADPLNVWWPANNASMQGLQPFKALDPQRDVSAYEMYWRVDGGQWNRMETNYTSYPHKEISVDLSSWSWHGSGPYVIDFVSRVSGADVASNSVSIFIENGLPKWTGSTGAPAPSPTPAPASKLVSTEPLKQAITITNAPTSAGNPLQSVSFYVNPNSSAALQLMSYDALQTLAKAPTSTWFGDWNANITEAVKTVVVSANAAGSVPVLVAYNIPQRDCGGFSAGGTNAYGSWINSFASGIGSGKAIVILEPDAISQMGCLSKADQDNRMSLLASAVSTLKKNAGTKVYIDAGHSNWNSPDLIAERLRRANIALADGFALNVSNFMTTTDEVTFGSDVSSKVSGKHFVIDTSRNGNGSNGEWCNPPGRAIGELPTNNTGKPLVDAYLWVKVPGESDGQCNGGPSAGTWWPEYAAQLVQNAR